MDARDLLASVQRGDVARLTGIPGIGKKTAERIVLELRDRLAQLPGATPVDVATVNGADRVRGDLLSALQNLGYHRPQAEKAVDATLQTMSEPTFEQALKAALRELMR
jgi:Holliday junction DNA helicase RuvA